MDDYKEIIEDNSFLSPAELKEMEGIILQSILANKNKQAVPSETVVPEKMEQMDSNDLPDLALANEE